MSYKAKMMAKVEECVKLAEDTYGVDLSNLDVRFDIRGYRVAGQAISYRSSNRFELRFHPEACEKHLDTMMAEVVPHEVAHLVCRANPSLGRNHNPGWKRVCIALGGTGERLHTMDFGNAPTDEERELAWRARRPYVYVCSRGIERHVSLARHKRLQAGEISVSYKTKPGRPGGVIERHNFTYVDTATKRKLQELKAQRKAKKVSKKRKAAVTATGLDRTQKILDFKARNGGKSKAVVCREIIAANYSKLTDAEIIALIRKKCEFDTTQMAKHYFKANLVKAVAS